MSSLLGNSLKYLGVKGPDFATFKWFKRREKESEKETDRQTDIVGSRQNLRPMGHERGAKPRVRWFSNYLCAGVNLLLTSVYITLKGSFSQQTSI